MVADSRNTAFFPTIDEDNRHAVALDPRPADSRRILKIEVWWRNLPGLELHHNHQPVDKTVRLLTRYPYDPNNVFIFRYLPKR